LKFRGPLSPAGFAVERVTTRIQLSVTSSYEKVELLKVKPILRGGWPLNPAALPLLLRIAQQICAFLDRIIQVRGFTYLSG
jgi:hypothetical protein